jgi:hypothetical protein
MLRSMLKTGIGTMIGMIVIAIAGEIQLIVKDIDRDQIHLVRENIEIVEDKIMSSINCD